MLISTELLESFAEIKGSDPVLETNYIECAEEIVSQYLGYSISESAYDDKLIGNGLPYIKLSSFNVSNLVLAVDSKIIDSSIYRVDGCFAIIKSGVFTKNSTISATYQGGWTSINAPALIKNCILEIASLKASEAGEHISVTTYSVGLDGGSRTFQNTTNFSKYLKSLNKYRLSIL
jgi:hypothetical protein